MQLLDARQALTEAGEPGAAAVQQAQQQAEQRQGDGGEVLAAVHAAMADDLNTAQVRWVILLCHCPPEGHGTYDSKQHVLHSMEVLLCRQSGTYQRRSHA
jgi:hypothetical protein